ncbi:ABC transporter permease, partial [Photobacterium sanctipauli]
MIHLAYLLVLIVFITPLIPGVLGILLPAVSWLPPLGYVTPHLGAFATVADWPNLVQSVLLSLFTGMGSSLLALVATFLILRRFWLNPRWQKIEYALSPMLAMPHVAFAIGFSFLLAPSGWLYRGFEALGVNTAGSYSLIQDPYGIGLLLALAIKEIPFLLIMSISVLQQLNVHKQLAVANGLGYDNKQAWLKVILPQWLPKIRLPLFAVAAYGISVVDVALILGPSRPTTLSVLVWQWFNDPDLALMPRAAVGALLLLTTTAFGLLVFRTLEWLGLKQCRQWQITGAATLRNSVKSKISGSLLTLVTLLPFMLLPLLVIWSFAQRWRFPDLLPTRYSFRFWQQELTPLVELIGNSMMLALLSCAVALVMAIFCLEYRNKYLRGLPLWCIAIPLVAPQLSLLFG